MKQSSPSRWMEAILLLMLACRDRESVAGDLQEEYRAVKLPALGRLRADLWYARHVLSFLPPRMAAIFAESPLLMLLCGFTALCGLWLGAMGLRLRHAGYGEGELIAATIVLQAGLTLLALCFRSSRLLRWVVFFGASVVSLLALQALIATFRGAHFEGYVLLIALCLLAQAMLTYINLKSCTHDPADKLSGS